MDAKAKLYKGIWLMPGSTALKLLEEGKTKALEEHMAQVEKNHRKLVGG